MTSFEQINEMANDYIMRKSCSEVFHLVMVSHKKDIIKTPQCMKMLELLNERYFGKIEDTEVFDNVKKQDSKEMKQENNETFDEPQEQKLKNSEQSQTETPVQPVFTASEDSPEPMDNPF